MSKKNMMTTIDTVTALLQRTGVSEEDIRKIENLKTKIANRELVISVIGQFKRGKTSFINGVLEAAVLPVGIIPVTSVATRIQYGNELAEVHFKSGESQTVALEQLVGYIAEQQNPNNQKGVSFVNLFLPDDFLKDGITLVDTPGVGSIHQNNTDEAYAIMKDSDAIIFMLSVDSPINEIEREFLVEARNYTAKFYFAINKIDTISEDDLEIYLAYCHEILCEIMAVDTIELFAISAKTNAGMDTLFAKIAADITVSADQIIVESVQIKFREVLGAAHSHLELYRRAYGMPLKSLEEKRSELEEKLVNLDQITRDSSFYLLRHIDELLEQIRAELQDGSVGIRETLTVAMAATYQKNREMKPKELEKALMTLLEKQLSAQLNDLSERGLASLALGYEHLTELLNQKIDDLKEFLRKVVAELFGINYQVDTIVHTLSSRDDFYVKVNQKPAAFLVDINDLIYLMPRGYANKKIYTRYQNKMLTDVEHNINNMIYNYQYKIRESVRDFKGVLERESQILKQELSELVNRVITDKEDTSKRLGDKIRELDDICERLMMLLKEL
ncbi:dynamin family protein [Acetobacterium sp. K1/6]|uniref:dynamin family protein n=1 Tax=Acetobacterium sp. K1/6 TaxID=3055467 RepID=UPI002ACAE630|nr:dynamin family protein [Acetobacterium sp. K1/6]MDZ5723720.1 dynamin family protein [Acetobacterium sp. K1/6]